MGQIDWIGEDVCAVINMKLRLRRCDISFVQGQLSAEFFRIADSLFQGRTAKVGEIRRLYGTISNKWDWEYFPHIVGCYCVKLESWSLDGIVNKRVI